MEKDIDNLCIRECENPFENISTKLLINFAKTASILEDIFNQYYKRFKLSKPQFNALYLIYISGSEGITLSELGDKMVVTRANITSLIDRMESRNYIERVINPNDRRSIKAVIRKEGIEIINKILPTHKIFSKEILGFLTEAEKERVNKLLEKILEEIKKSDMYTSK